MMTPNHFKLYAFGESLVSPHKAYDSYLNGDQLGSKRNGQNESIYNLNNSSKRLDFNEHSLGTGNFSGSAN